ncbi:MAG: hypothetical protein CVU42_09385 [Chloroflexi bacterium HGW-Chloroflexi-4]|jgi:hypothetical protein|nr:MAG: hypothetical protein CVU42_09385 [Chloroflexi bacterium HGW-Chloroflexi-4]
MRIAVYGGAAPKPGEQAYEDARQLGFLLGKSGHTIMTGGYIGVMEAASRGASEAGAHVIGSTCIQLETWRGITANQWVKEEWKHETLRDRLYALVEKCDAAVMMPGGVGTLAELAVMWNEEIISMKPGRMMVLVGKGWQKTVEMFIAELGGYMPEHDQKRVIFAEDIQAAVELINKFEAETQKS